MDNPKSIEYLSERHFRGSLYDYHRNPFTDKWYYQMSVFAPGGREILHAFYATPKTVQELKNVVEREEENWIKNGGDC